MRSVSDILPAGAAATGLRPAQAPLPDGALERILSLPTADAHLLKSRALLRRVDCKFVAPALALNDVLDGLAGQYGVLLARAARLATYETLYFDTPALDFYHDHRRGRRPRCKVRVRHYPEREVSFLEIKRKTASEVTDKRRRERPFRDVTLTDADRAWLAEWLGEAAFALTPAASTDFRRLTLLGLDTPNRVTIDVDLVVGRDGAARSLAGAMIVEVKQATHDLCTPTNLALRAAGARRGRASKYALAVTLLAPEIRHNRLRVAARQLVAATAPERSTSWPRS